MQNNNTCAGTSMNNPCPENNKKPSEVCEDVKKTYNFLEDIVKSSTEIASGLTPGGILKTVGSSNKATTNQKTICNNIINSTNIIDSVQRCNNIVNSTQTNVISQPAACAELQSKIITSLKDNPTALKEYLSSLSIENVTQTNESNDLQQCILSAYMSAINEQQTSIDTAAIAMLLQKSSDLLSSNEINQNQCQNLNNTLSSCNYLKSITCCSNQVTNAQSNELYNCIGATKNIVQKNLKNNYQFCNMSNTSSLSSKELAALLNRSTVDATQISTGTSIFGFLLFFLIPIIAFGGSTVVAALIFKKAMPFLGFVPIIIGAIFLIFYFTSKPSKMYYTIKDKPLISSTQIKSNNYGGNTNISYIDAYNYCENDDNCVAVDFIYDKTNPKINSSVTTGTPYNIQGSSIYYSSKDGIATEDPKSDKKSYYTFYKNTEKTTLYVGILAIIIGILYSILFMVYTVMYKKQ